MRDGRGICGVKSKQRYSRSDALRAMKALQAEHRRIDDHVGLAQLYIYKCGSCRRRHVGRNTRKRVES